MPVSDRKLPPDRLAKEEPSLILLGLFLGNSYLHHSVEYIDS